MATRFEQMTANLCQKLKQMVQRTGVAARLMRRKNSGCAANARAISFAARGAVSNELFIMIEEAARTYKTVRPAVTAT
jgi:hypothetical protein